MRRQFAIFSILILAVVFPAAATGINSSIHVDFGEVVDHDLSTLNGNIEIGDGATIRGDAESVNGRIEVGHNVTVESVSAVNGGIEIGERTIVDGDVETVNGPISMGFYSSARSVGTVNGPVKLTGTEVADDVSTYNGDVTLRDGTSVGGDIRIHEIKGGSSDRNRPLRIYVEGDSVVKGDIIVEDDAREVEVHLRGGTVAGQIRGATVVKG